MWGVHGSSLKVPDFVCSVSNIITLLIEVECSLFKGRSMSEGDFSCDVDGDSGCFLFSFNHANFSFVGGASRWGGRHVVM